MIASAAADGLGGVGLLVVVLGVLYLAPALVAVIRRHNQRGSIAALNIFLGWTFLGWVVAMVWAWSNPQKVVQVPDQGDPQFSEGHRVPRGSRPVLGDVPAALAARADVLTPSVPTTSTAVDSPKPDDAIVISRRAVKQVGVIAAAVVVVAGAFGVGRLTSSRRSNNEVALAPAGLSATIETTSTTENPTTATVPSVATDPLPTGNGFDYQTAVQKVASLGYVVDGQDNEAAMSPLAVLIGTCAGNMDGYCQQAFFFVDNRYIGTDDKKGDEQVSVSWQNSTTVALSYPIYQANDPMCCPSGGSRLVRFSWNGVHLAPLDPLPSDPNKP